MKLATRVLFALALLSAPACRQQRFFVDMDRATWGTEAGKRAMEKLQRELGAKKRENSDADAAAKKAEEAKAPDAPAARAAANATAQRLETEFSQSREASRQGLVTGLRPALIRVAADRHIDAIEWASSMAFVDPGVDVTEEVVRRANDAERSSEVERLKAENESLKAKGKP